MEYFTEAPILPEEAVKELKAAGAGSLLFHFAVVRDVSEDKTNIGAHYERAGDTDVELATIAADIRARFAVTDVLLIRRVGDLKIGDVISLVAVSAERSRDAFAACQHGLDSLKQMKTIKKSELFI